MEGFINSFAFGMESSGREDLAIQLFQYNIELHPNNPVMINNLGYYYMQKGKRKEAISQFRASLRLRENVQIRRTMEKLEKEIAKRKK